MFIVLSVVYIWGVISCNTLLSKSVQIKFKMFIIHTNFLLFFAIYDDVDILFSIPECYVNVITVCLSYIGSEFR